MRKPFPLLFLVFCASHGQVLYQYTMANHVHFPNVDFSSKILDDGERITVDCVDGQKCKLCSNWYKAGDSCSNGQELEVIQCNPDLNIVEIQENAFYACKNHKLELEFCPRGSIYRKEKGCFDPTKHMYRQAHASAFPGSGRVGDVCAFNTDCLSGMYCSGGQCACLSTFILREGYCYEKINPNQPGCTYDIQCSAVWPEAKCSMDSGVGTCRCPENTHVARETRDGWVCVSLKDHGTGGSSSLYFICPLPEGAGFKIALNDPDPQFGSFPVGCTVGSSAQVEPVAGLHGGAACIWPSTGEFVGDIYDCVHTSPQVS
ncbi:hypothetical protein QR680_014916 [Steinernema hermaphroditum]|uniref:EB domain-containing protein n=1 Tax=Steinernema hermaphroditum TaxID=289476 RepID=A0AA39ID32_9BILA|nr:hypothetical protein QR680_014916 [Steinernema hermaphroditum]